MCGKRNISCIIDRNRIQFLSNFRLIRTQVLYMEISIFGHANNKAATNRHTDMVFPNRRGVDIRISWLIPFHEFFSNNDGYEHSKNPAGSVLKSTRTTAFKNDSYKTFNNDYQ